MSSEPRSGTAERARDRVLSDPRSGLTWRLIGPHRGGRAVAAAGHPTAPQVFYFGHCAGGVWKTDDGGRFWENVSDGFFGTAAVGALAIAAADPNVLYVGMGETTIRGNVSHGDGVYGSTDGGRSWRHLGLRDTRHVAKVRIHPNNPNLVYVAALGHAYGPNSARGVFRSSDGGATWEKILYRSERAGAIDLSMDPTNPRILYAALWQAQRSPYSLSSGGPDSGLYRSTDGGDSWVDLKSRPGLPEGIWGKVGVAVSPANPARLWALVEAAAGGLFRSDDRGETWQRITDERRIWQRAWYFMHIFADPQDAETVWVLNVQAWKSSDGGRLFQAVPTPFEDQHDLWIDPHNPLRLIEANDGGACVSFNGGASWSTQYNQPTAQFYHVTTDDQVPYRVYGAQQDINTLSLPSRSRNAAITAADWYTVGGGESGFIAVRPGDSNTIYAGSFGGHLTRYDHRSGQVQDISVWPDDPMGWGARDLKERFQWTFPIAVSRHDPDVLYVTSQHVHRSHDGGMTWRTISPDLTRNDPQTLGPSGGPITSDNVSTEYYATIFAFAESPLQAGVLWAGSDDGLIHLSRDGGQAWANVTPPPDLLPEWAMISIIEPSPHDPACAYVAATRYKSDDFAPLLLRTNDHGQTWTKIVAGLGEADFTRVIRADPEQPGLLFAGTETGVYVSFDDGGTWHRLQTNLPVVPIHDLAVKDGDLVAATHGRSFWILDDFTPLREWGPEVQERTAHLFRPRPAIRFRGFHGFSLPAAEGKNSRLVGPVHVSYRVEELPSGAVNDVLLDAGQNPPHGVGVTYYLAERPAVMVELSFLDAAGHLIESFSSDRREGRRFLAAEPGLHRFVWDMRYPAATSVEGATFWGEGGAAGPLAVPGAYQARLTVGDEVLSQPVVIQGDPHVSASPAELTAQFDLLIAIRDKLSQTHAAANQITDLRRQLTDWSRRAAARADLKPIADRAAQIDSMLTSIDRELIERSQDLTYHHPIRLNAKLAALAAMVGSADSAPTQAARRVFEELSEHVGRELERLRLVIETEITTLNEQLGALNVPPIDPGALRR